MQREQGGARRGAEAVGGIGRREKRSEGDMRLGAPGSVAAESQSCWC